MDLRAALETRARELGFARLGVARVEPLHREAATLTAWLRDGMHASMGWMADTAEVRLDPTHPGMLPGARSVIAFATPYAREGGSAGPSPGVVARYARGRDYHNVIGKRMRKLTRMLKEAGHQARMSVDSVPVLERAWAQRAGIGFIGKNACLIIPGLGSHVLLSTIVTDAELPADAPMAERCGSCRLCLDACPTDAFRGPRVLDAGACISYLTIEHRGPIDPALRAQMGSRLFGCDICQDVCPYNRTAPPDAADTEPFAADPRLDVPLERVLRMDDDAHRSWAHGSPLRRPGREGMARNAAIVLGNSGARRHLPVLREAAVEDPSETVRSAARWALERLSAATAEEQEPEQGQ